MWIEAGPGDCSVRRQDRHRRGTEHHEEDPPQGPLRRTSEEGSFLIVLLKDCEKTRGESIQFPLALTASWTARDTGENCALNLGFLLEKSLIDQDLHQMAE